MRKVVVFDVVTDLNALSLPSHITADRVEGFALTMGKVMLSGQIDEVVDTIKVRRATESHVASANAMIGRQHEGHKR